MTISAAATAIPSLAGWYTGDPTSVDNSAQNLAAVNSGYTRYDSVVTGPVGSTAGTAGSAAAAYGIWCSHIVVAGNLATIGNGLMGGLIGQTGTITWNAAASIKDGVTGATSGAGNSQFAAPAPGAIALVGIAGFASRRRRS